MKYGFMVGLVAALVLGVIGCGAYDGTAVLTVTIQVQPEGGYGVDSVSCTYRGVARDTGVITGDLLSEPITLTSEWHTPHGTYNKEKQVWTSDQERRTITTTKAAPPGAHLDKDFWLVLTWTDAGGDHSAQSLVAECR